MVSPFEHLYITTQLKSYTNYNHLKLLYVQVPAANNLEPLLNERLRQLSLSFLLSLEGLEGEQNLIHIFIFALLLFSNLRNMKKYKEIQRFVL